MTHTMISTSDLGWGNATTQSEQQAPPPPPPSETDYEQYGHADTIDSSPFNEQPAHYHQDPHHAYHAETRISIDKDKLVKLLDIFSQDSEKSKWRFYLRNAEGVLQAYLVKSDEIMCTAIIGKTDLTVSQSYNPMELKVFLDMYNDIYFLMPSSEFVKERATVNPL